MKKIALLFAVLLPLLVLAGGDTPQEKYIAKYSAIAVSEMQRSGVMGGVGNNRFAPKGNYTREQSICTMLSLLAYLQE